MKKLTSLLLTLSILCYNCQPTVTPSTKKVGENWTFPDSLDAVKIAPKSHEVLLENEKVRVLLVKLNPGEKEPMHTHVWESVMMVDHPARIRYYDVNDKILYETPKENFSYEARKPNWMDAEGVHAIENIDTTAFIARRIELKN